MLSILILSLSMLFSIFNFTVYSMESTSVDLEKEDKRIHNMSVNLSLIDTEAIQKILITSEKVDPYLVDTLNKVLAFRKVTDKYRVITFHNSKDRTKFKRVVTNKAKRKLNF